MLRFGKAQASLVLHSLLKNIIHCSFIFFCPLCNPLSNHRQDAFIHHLSSMVVMPFILDGYISGQRLIQSTFRCITWFYDIPAWQLFGRVAHNGRMALVGCQIQTCRRRRSSTVTIHTGGIEHTFLNGVVHTHVQSSCIRLNVIGCGKLGIVYRIK